MKKMLINALAHSSLTLPNFNVWRVLTALLIIAPLGYTLPNQIEISLLIWQNITNTDVVYALLTLLLQLPLLLFGIAGIVYTKWYEIGWFVYGRRQFRKYMNAQNLRISFLVTCGSSLPVAISTVIDDLAVKFEALYTLTDRSSDDHEVNNYEEYFKDLADRLQSCYDKENVSTEDQKLAIECMRKYVMHGRRALAIQYRDLLV